MTESVGVVIAALIAALTFTVGEIIRVRERRRDQIATRVAEVQLAVRAFTLEAVRSEARDEAVQLKTAMHATGAITSLLAVVPKRDRSFVMRQLQSVGTVHELPPDQTAILLATVSAQLDTWLMSPKIGRKQDHPRDRLTLRQSRDA